MLTFRSSQLGLNLSYLISQYIDAEPYLSPQCCIHSWQFHLFHHHCLHWTFSVNMPSRVVAALVIFKLLGADLILFMCPPQFASNSMLLTFKYQASLKTVDNCTGIFLVKCSQALLWTNSWAFAVIDWWKSQCVKLIDAEDGLAVLADFLLLGPQWQLRLQLAELFLSINSMLQKDCSLSWMRNADSKALKQSNNN